MNRLRIQILLKSIGGGRYFTFQFHFFQKKSLHCLSSLGLNRSLLQQLGLLAARQSEFGAVCGGCCGATRTLEKGDETLTRASDGFLLRYLWRDWWLFVG